MRKTQNKKPDKHLGTVVVAAFCVAVGPYRREGTGRIGEIRARGLLESPFTFSPSIISPAPVAMWFRTRLDNYTTAFGENGACSPSSFRLHFTVQRPCTVVRNVVSYGA